MSMRRMAIAGVLAMGTVLVGVTVVAPLAAQATANVVRARPTCYACLLLPSIQIDSVSADQSSVTASGSNFTAGGAVHLDLVRAVGTPVPSGEPVNAEVAASLDTQATYPLNLPLGTGQVVHVEGGRVSGTLYEAPPPCGYYSLWLIATNEETGRSYTSAPSWTDRSCD